MNLERFHTIISTTKFDFDSSKVPQHVGELVSHLTQQINDPANPEHQKTLSNTKKILLNALSRSPSNMYPPSWKDFLREFGLKEFLAPYLRQVIVRAFSGNEITPQLTLEQIQKINQTIQNHLNAVNNILQGFEQLNVKEDKLDAGASEISFSIPREFISNDPTRLGFEIIKMEKLFSPFAEMAIGEPRRFSVRTISSSDFLIDFTVLSSIYEGAKTTAAVAAAIGSIILVYQQVLKVRMMKLQLKEMTGTEKEKAKAQDALSNLVEGSIKKGIDRATQELFKNHNKITNKARTAQLKKLIKSSMKELAARIDRGYDFETRMGELPPPPQSEAKEGEEAKPVKENRETIEIRKSYEVIEAEHREQLEFEREGEPILSLPDPNNDNGDD